MSEKTFFFVKREIPLLFFVNCERADLFFVKRDLYPPFTTLKDNVRHDKFRFFDLLQIEVTPVHCKCI